jgi:hypothetical protein
MATASASKNLWEVADEGSRLLSLEIRLRQQSYILPWSMFLYAQGNDAEIRAVFHTHEVLIQGAGLTSLLSDLAAQSVKKLVEPDRTAKFAPGDGPLITAVSVTEGK